MAKFRTFWVPVKLIKGRVGKNAEREDQVYSTTEPVVYIWFGGVEYRNLVKKKLENVAIANELQSEGHPTSR